MRNQHPFLPDDLADLDLLLGRADAVVPMCEIAAGDTRPNVIGLRHDVDNVIEPAVRFAEWEANRGYRSSYYILHTAPYWADKDLLLASLGAIAGFGHEIGLHNNALAAATDSGHEPSDILADALAELRGYGFHISGTVAHGDHRCYDNTGQVRLVNDELFSECSRPSLGSADRTVAGVQIRPIPLAELGLDYDANWLRRRVYLSDSGGRWSQPGFDTVADGFPYDGQLHMLVHPDWWGSAFAPAEIAA